MISFPVVSSSWNRKTSGGYPVPWLEKNNQPNSHLRIVVVVVFFFDNQSQASPKFHRRFRCLTARDSRHSNEAAVFPTSFECSTTNHRSSAGVSTNAQQLPECSSVVEIEDGVNERVQGAVHVTEPRDEVDHSIRWTTSRTERHDHVHEKER